LVVSLVRSTHHSKGLQSSAEITKTFCTRHSHGGTTSYPKDSTRLSTYLFTTFTGQTRSRPDLIRVKDVDTTNMCIVYVNSNQQSFRCTQSTDELRIKPPANDQQRTRIIFTIPEAKQL